jgi:hypothetical protein
MRHRTNRVAISRMVPSVGHVLPVMMNVATQVSTKRAIQILNDILIKPHGQAQFSGAGCAPENFDLGVHAGVTRSFEMHHLAALAIGQLSRIWRQKTFQHAGSPVCAPT